MEPRLPSFRAEGARFRERCCFVVLGILYPMFYLLKEDYKHYGTWLERHGKTKVFSIRKTHVGLMGSPIPRHSKQGPSELARLYVCGMNESILDQPPLEILTVHLPFITGAE